MSDRIGDWFLTASGKRFYPFDPRPEDIDLEDIGHALAQDNRFGGHTRWPYSVAQHSYLCSIHVRPGFEREALLHDAAEAYLRDMMRPVKKALSQYQELEESIWKKAIAPAFDLPETMSPEVEFIDDAMCATEARVLLRHEPGDDWWNLPPWPAPLDIKIKPWSFKKAKRWFISRYYELI